MSHKLLQNVDAETWKKLKLLAMERDIRMAEMLTVLIDHYDKTSKKKKTK